LTAVDKERPPAFETGGLQGLRVEREGGDKAAFLFNIAQEESLAWIKAI